ncbi:MAG: glycosyltransferase [Acidobacteriota bacterium]
MTDAKPPLATPPLEVWLFRPTMGHGGADRVTLTLLQHLDRRRFRPTLVLMQRSGPFLEGIPEDVPVLSLDAPRLVSAVRPLAALLRNPPPAGPPDLLFSTASGTNLVVTLLPRHLRRRFGLMLSERSTLQRDDRAAWKNRLLLFAKSRLYGRAQRIAAVSAGIADDLVARTGFPRQRIDVVFNPVVSDSLHQRASETVAEPWLAEADDDDGPQVILAAGRLVPVKDYGNLLAAFARLQRERPRARLVVLGEGPERTTLEAQAEALGIADVVKLPGFVDNPFAWMSRATVFALSSRFEGLPGVLIQAMACGAAAVSTDCPTGPSEIIRDGENGLLVPVSDPAALATAVGRLLDDAELRRRLSRQGRRDMRQFGLEASLRRYSDTLERTASERAQWTS